MKILLTLLLTLALAACAPAATEPDPALPTLADLPTMAPSATALPSITPSDTPVPSITPTAPPSATVTATMTPSATITDTVTPTPTATLTSTPRASALGALVELALVATILPPTYLPAGSALPPGFLNASTPTSAAVPPACTTTAQGGFGAIYNSNAQLAAQLGCPLGDAISSPSAVQQYERGSMIWLNGPIYVLDNSGVYRRFEDSFVAGVDPESGGEVPPPGLIAPVRGFGKVWRSNPDVRTNLGWATTPEAGGEARYQRFERGWMIYLTQRGDILAMIEDPGGVSERWQAFAGMF